MKVIWQDSKQRGMIDDHVITIKPPASFAYEYLLVNDELAEYTPREAANYSDKPITREDMEAYYVNRPMTSEQKREIIDFYNAWTPPVAQEPSPQDQIDSERRRLILQVEAQRDQAFIDGVPHDFGAGPDAIQVREVDRANLNGLVLAAKELQESGDTTTKTPFRAKSNTIYELLPAEVIAMGSAAFAGVNQIYGESWTKKDQLRAIAESFSDGDDVEATLAAMQAVLGA